MTQETFASSTQTIGELTAWKRDLPQDEIELINIYRRAKQLGYADIAIAIQERKRVKLWLTEKLK